MNPINLTSASGKIVKVFKVVLLPRPIVVMQFYKVVFHVVGFSASFPMSHMYEHNFPPISKIREKLCSV